MEKFKIEDLSKFAPAKIGFDHFPLEQAHFEAAAKHHQTFTVWYGESIVAIGGLVEYWKGRSEAWGIVAENSTQHFLGLHKIVKNFLDSQPGRIEATTEKAFPEGHRWLMLLGFTLEAPRLKGYGYMGKDHSLYARYRP